MKFFSKIMFEEKKLLSKISKNSTYLKLTSLAIAIILFLSLNGSGILGIGNLFTTNKYISNIPVNIVSDDGKIVTGIPKTIGVNIIGSEANVKSFEQNHQNIEASVNLSGKDDGEYKINSDEIKFSKNYGVEIQPLVSNYNVTIDTLTEITMPVNIEYINKDKNQSVLIASPEVESSTVTFAVGQMQKENIANVKVILDISNIDTSKNKTEYIYNEKIKVYNKDGELMELPNELPEYKVTLPYELKSVLKPVKYQILNNKTDEYVSFVCKEGSETYNENCQDTINVYGDEEKIQNTDYIIYNVDLSNFDKNSPTVLATPSLESGVFVGNNKSYNVKVGMEEGTTKTFKNNSIIVENLSNELEAVNLEKLNLSIKITGSKSIVDKMTQKDFQIYVDAEDITDPNIVKVPLKVYINNLLTYTLSENEVNIEFKEK